MDITDEMVEAAERAAFPGLPAGMSAEEARRRVKAAAEVLAPLIAAQAALAERVKIVAEIRQHAERTARTLGSSRAASIAVAAIENEVADRVNTLRAERTGA